MSELAALQTELILTGVAVWLVILVGVWALGRAAARGDEFAARADIAQRVQEREAQSWLRPRSGHVQPLGGEEPPTAYGTEHDGIGR
jgi:biopolymer transport protein ExbB/TolQ